MYDFEIQLHSTFVTNPAEYLQNKPNNDITYGFGKTAYAC